MTRATHDLLEQVLALTQKERSEIVEKLIESLDGPPGLAEDDPVFIAELTRRAERLESGESQGTDWKVVHDRIRRKLEQR